MWGLNTGRGCVVFFDKVESARRGNEWYIYTRLWEKVTQQFCKLPVGILT